MIEAILKWLMRDQWEYGTAIVSTRARRHRRTGEVQCVLWKAGEQGHTVDFWHEIDPSWWNTFVKD